MGQWGKEGISGRVWVEREVGVCWDGPEMDGSTRKGWMEGVHGDRVVDVSWDGQMMDGSTRKGQMEKSERRWERWACAGMDQRWMDP